MLDYEVDSVAPGEPDAEESQVRIDASDKDFEIEEDEEVRIEKYSITSYGADIDVIGLVRRLNDREIHIPPFQRDYVWSLKEASRFIESLLLGLPVPSLFLCKDKDNTLLVIDGQQRLKSLQFYYNGIFDPTKKVFSLIDVQPEFVNQTYKTLSGDDRRTLDNSFIHSIIIRQEEPTDDESSVYHVFERLNTGGKRLTPQEIRTCLYHGEYVRILSELNNSKQWRDLAGPRSRFQQDQEMILRFLALFFDRNRYAKPMKDFLNKHLARNRELQRYDHQRLQQAFQPTVEFICAEIGKNAFRPSNLVVRGLADALMYGVAVNLERATITSDARRVYGRLLEDADFIKACRVGTSDPAAVNLRLDRALNAFSM